MSLIEEFLPAGGPPTVGKIWKRNAIIIVVITVLLALATTDMLMHLVLEGAALLALITMMMATREPVSIVISTTDSRFTYRYMNCFGRIKDTIVYLPNAKISYKYVFLHRYTRGWRLRLYNNYFSNRITIKEEKANGFSMKQMDSMVGIMNQLRGVAGN